MSCTLRCCDVGLVNEWTRTCNEYMVRLRRPFSAVPLRQLWRCDQPDWSQAFTEWSVFQFWLSVVAAAVGNIILYVIDREFLQGATTNFVLYTIAAYVQAHVGWFAVVKRQGCCFLVCCCLEGRPLLLMWGVLSVLCGACQFLFSFFYIQICGPCVIIAALQGLSALVLIYMGVCCVRLWHHLGWWERGVKRDIQVVEGVSAAVEATEVKVVQAPADGAPVAAPAGQPAGHSQGDEAGRKGNERELEV